MARPGSRNSRKSEKKQPRPIIIKRITKRVKPSHSSGTWKIAYADFVTAMMAFFLLLWLTGTVTSNNLRGVAEYFKTPLMLALQGGREDSDVDSIINGGSKTVLQDSHQVQRGEVLTKKPSSMKDAKVNLRLQEITRLRELKSHLANVIALNPALSQYKDQLLLDITSDGLRIQIIDKQNRPMFAVGSSALQPYTVDILHEIGNTLNEVPNKISLSGHTDARPYQGGAKNYSNWDLSVDRANASRRALIAGGMDPAKIMRVVGLSSSVLFDSSDPYNPSNRRISIIVMNRSAEEAIAQQSGSENTIKLNPDGA